MSGYLAEDGKSKRRTLVRTSGSLGGPPSRHALGSLFEFLEPELSGFCWDTEPRSGTVGTWFSHEGRVPGWVSRLPSPRSQPSFGVGSRVDHCPDGSYFARPGVGPWLSVWFQELCQVKWVLDLSYTRVMSKTNLWVVEVRGDTWVVVGTLNLGWGDLTIDISSG